MLNLIRWLLRLCGFSEKDLMEKVFKNVVLGGGKSGAAGGASGGGLGGLMEQFKDKGLGDVFQSWVAKGPNHLITPEQVREGLGDEKIRAMAQQSGQTPEQVTQKLATLMPAMIDKMTPGGTLPSQ